jgi:hypothetical protein
VGRAGGTHGRGEKVYKGLVGKPEGKRTLGRPRRRWENEIRMDLGEIGLGGGDWIRLTQDRDRWRAVVSAVMNLRVLAPRSWLVVHVRPSELHLEAKAKDVALNAMKAFRGEEV